MLAAFGAEVLRIDDPHHPELPRSAIDGVIGKLSATLDLATRSGGETLHALLPDADVLVTGYRPGALRRFGLDPDQVAERHPGTIVVSLSAWGSSGPWSSRRGFDSLVQIATGIGWATSPDGTRPGVLPCQLLDHATGYLIAATTMAALAHRGRTGQARSARLSLTRTAHWLQQQGTRADLSTAQDPYPDDPYRRPLGDGWTGIAPPGQLEWHPAVLATPTTALRPSTGSMERMIEISGPPWSGTHWGQVPACRRAIGPWHSKERRRSASESPCGH
jgi:crotonobetainyl-CoA:carnitine CoA-transferase CaiB-like acyl-CoA transferase